MDNFVTFRVKQGKRESQLTQNLVALYTSFILGTERTEFFLCCPRRRPSLLWNSRRSRALEARGPAHDLTQCDITDSSDSVSYLKLFFEPLFFVKPFQPRFNVFSFFFSFSISDACLRCQAENRNDKEQEECVVIWGECNHSFHNCCMKLWV